MKFYLILWFIASIQVLNAAPAPRIGLFSNVLKSVGNVLTTTVDATKNLTTNVVTVVADTTKSVSTAVVDTTKSVTTATTDIAGKVADTTVKTVKSVTDVVVDVVSVVPKIVIQLIDGINDVVRNLGEKLLQNTEEIAASDTTTANTVDTDLVATVVSVGNSLMENPYDNINIPVDDETYIPVAGAIVESIRREAVDDTTGITELVYVTGVEMDKHSDP